MKYIARNAAARMILAALMIVATTSLSRAFDVSHYATTSQLSTGKWVKLKVDHSGMYQITSEQARNLGFSGVEHLKVYGRGGNMLSEKLTVDIVDDLPAVPVYRPEGGGRLLFYAYGPVSVGGINSSEYVPVQNTYSSSAYYLVTEDPETPDPTVEKSEVPVTGSAPVTAFRDYVFHEEELVNTGETGRTFLGEDMRVNRSRDFDFTLPGLVEGSTVSVRTSFAAKINAGTTGVVSFIANDKPLEKSAADNVAVIADVAHDHYNWANTTKSFVLEETNQLKYKVTFSCSGNVEMARLNYIAVNYQRQLNLAGAAQLSFRYGSMLSTGMFEIAGADENTVVWNVTNPNKAVQQNVVCEEGRARFSTAFVLPQTFVAFDPTKTMPSPEFAGDVENQNIHGMAVPDMIIITPKEYIEQAQRVASLHEKEDAMKVHVFTDNQVYNEFSAGTPDAMAYRMVSKYFYDRGEQEGHKLGYLLLFGNGSYDNRGVSQEFKGIAYPKLLTWQTNFSDNENDSYISDDPFIILGDDSGPNFYRELPTIAVGRMPVKSVNEARIMVNKLVKYVTKPDYGSWKNNVLNVADDGDDGVHMKQAEAVITAARTHGGEHAVFNRVYLDATTRASDGGVSKYPDARKKMYSTLQDGVVWWNFTGHSGISTWTGDGLMLKGDIRDELYYKHLPILYAATCEFTRIDAVETSGGEMMLLNNAGGAIAVVCPARLALVHSNGPLNEAVGRHIFERDSKGLPLRLGDIILRGKREYTNDDNTMRYLLCGDPAMRPAFPSYRAVVDEINDEAVGGEELPILQARQTVTFKGHIENERGQEVNDFTGYLLSTLYDCETSVTSHGYGSDGQKFVFHERANKLSINNTDVSSGKFSVTMTIPSEVLASYDNFQPSLLSLYAYSTVDSLEANGSCDKFYIYGFDDTVEADTIGPDIIYFRLNNKEFKNGDNVGDSPVVLIMVGDETGLNFSNAGIGHTMTLTLDDKTTLSDVVNYYTPKEMPFGGTEGEIAYPLTNLSEGPHKLKFKVWDVFANSSEGEIQFIVSKSLKPDIVSVYCDANPASVETNFYVQHSMLNANVTIKLEVFDLMGREVWSTTQSGRSSLDTSFPIHWNLTDYSGSRVPRGIYIYRAAISTDGVHANSKSKKIAVTAQ